MIVFKTRMPFRTVVQCACSFLAFTSVCFGQVTWKNMTPPPGMPTFDCSDIAYGNDRFVAVDYRGNFLNAKGSEWEIAYTFQHENPGEIASINGIVYAKNLFVAAGWKMILTSPDGETWTQRIPDTSYIYFGVTYGNNMFVACGDSGLISTSPDGITWTSKYLGTGRDLSKIRYCKDRFFATAANSPNYPYVVDDTMYTSTDGSTWTPTKISVKALFNPITYGKNLFVTAGVTTISSSEIAKLYSSTDGITWSVKNTGVNKSIQFVLFAGDQFIAGGAEGLILTSPDAAAWTVRNQGGTGEFSAVCYGGGRFVAGGEDITMESKAENAGIVSKTGFSPATFKTFEVNVTNGWISAVVPNAAFNRQFRIGLFTVSGKNIYSAASVASSGTLTVPAAAIPAGKYIASVSDETGRLYTAPFVVCR